MSFIDALKTGDEKEMPLNPRVGPKTRVGKVVYIHPTRRYVLLEFTLENGQKLRECYCAYGKQTDGEG